MCSITGSGSEMMMEIGMGWEVWIAIWVRLRVRAEICVSTMGIV
jgi:hypothetical protein